MKRIATITGTAALLAACVSANAQFAGSNLVVSVVDSGTALAPTNAATVVRLVAYFRQNGRDVVTTGQSYTLPVALSGLNRALTLSGSATSEGQITLSSDGNYLLLGGYDAAPGTPGVATSSTTQNTTVTTTTSVATNVTTTNTVTVAPVSRVVARIDWTKPQATAIDTSTALTNILSKANIRGVASPDGQTLFISGSAGGVSQTTVGATTAANYGGTVTTNTRHIGLFNGNLYVSGATGSGPLYGVGQVTAGSTTQLTGFPTAVGPSSYGFYFLNPVTLYVADDRTTSTATAPTGGIQKWQLVGGTWTYKYTILIPGITGATAPFAGARGLAGTPYFDEDASQTFAQLYAVTTDNRIITVTDSNPGVVPTVIDTAAPGKVFRGVEVIRPKGVSIGGMATLAGAVNFQVPVTVEFRTLDVNGVPTGEKFSRTVTIAADQTYTVDDVPAGKAYQIHVKAANFLADNHNINTFSEDDLDADVVLLPGDADGNNTVDIGDFGILVNAYGGQAGVSGSGYDPRADFNNDGVVDIGDFGGLVNDYGQSGAP